MGLVFRVLSIGLRAQGCSHRKFVPTTGTRRKSKQKGVQDPREKPRPKFYGSSESEYLIP